MTMMPQTMAGVTWHEHAPLAPRTTYKVGGAADLLAEVSDRAGLSAVLAFLAAEGLPFLVIGNGSNLLISDAGYRGCVLVLGDAFKQTTVENDAGLIRAGSAVSITRLLRVARQAGLGGLQRLGGVPGTVGGAVRMNAGTRWGEAADILVDAVICHAGGEETRDVPSLGLAYRHSALTDADVIVEATFRGVPADEATLAEYDAVLEYRKKTQPLQYPSCGSVFANPPGDSAGRLIEAAGLKGTKIGGACIAEQHANWIINVGGATATDVFQLIALARKRVADAFGVTLRPEVRLIGAFPESLEVSA